MATKTKAPKIAFSEPELEAIRSAASGVWDECAYDMLQATADDKGKDINDVSVRRSVVIEIALDAGRPEERLKDMRRRKPELITDDFLARYAAASYEQLISIVKPAFPYSTYGL